MKNKIYILAIISFTICIAVSSCGTIGSGSEGDTPTIDFAHQADSSSDSGDISKSEDSTSPAITNVIWDASEHFINIEIDTWSNTYTPVKLLVDGVEIPLKDENGKVIIRPNAPLEQPPDGFIVGTLPWVTGLDRVDFPCCGSLQLSFPDGSITQVYDYNFIDFGCTTTSSKVCAPEWTVHEGDWIIKGSEIQTIENTKFLQKGNIYIKDSATLVLKNSELAIERGDTPTIHVYIFVDQNATLIIENSRVYPGMVNAGLTCVINKGNASIINSPTSIHYFDMSEGATLTMDNSSMIYDIGGLLQVGGGKTNITNSTLGSLGLYVPAGAHLDASGLKSGAYLENWKVQDIIPEADYELTLDKVTVLKDEFKGELKHGPYERGWIFFLDQNSHVRLSDSEVRKIFITIDNDEAEFQNLRIGKPSSLIYRDIILKDIIAQGEWSFEFNDANVTFSNSDYLFLQPSGNSKIKLINSHIIEFIPRSFTGTIEFENGSWSVAGEILGDLDYHSESNNFTITGSLRIDPNLQENLQWKDALVTRIFNVILTNSQGNPMSGGIIKINGEEYETDESGEAKIPIIFNETNYNQFTTLEALYSGEMVDQQDIDFFTETPIRLQQK